MRGKLGIVVGLAAGYVLGSRAGRERYEQIREGVGKLWQTAPVQKQVDKAKDLGKSAALALPSALWTGAVKVVKAAADKGSAGQKLDAVIDAGKDAAEDIAEGAEKTAAAVSKPAPAKKAPVRATSKTAAKKAPARTTKKASDS